MKKMITSAGLAALGVASVNAAAYAPGGSSVESTKPWSVSATLRGFYDDNINTSPKALREDSFGFRFSPSAAYNIDQGQTTLGLSYTYDLTYYADRQPHRADHGHQANAKLTHAFSERFKLDVSDSFVVSKEPTVIDPTVPTLTLRTTRDVIRNTGNITGTIGLTRELDLQLGYNNNWYDYKDPSISLALDRIEHLGMLNLRYTIIPSTIGILGYQYGRIDYTSKDSFAPGQPASERDSESHYVYVGVDHTFTQQLNASLRGGIQFTEYPNLRKYVGNVKDSTVDPYVDANVTYAYTVGSFAQLGVRHARNATDVGLRAGASPTLDSESTTVYGSLNHQFFPHFVGSLIGSYQHAEFLGGTADSQADDFYSAGVNLSYDINKFLAVEAGYAYDRLESDLDTAGLGRSFTRNRVYIGIRASY